MHFASFLSTGFITVNPMERKLAKRTSAQWCVFNNYSLDKHRHQLWHHFYFSFDEWNNKVALNFATIYHKKIKNGTFWCISLIYFLSKTLVLFRKKSLFILEKKYSKGIFLFKNFKSYIFALLVLLLSKLLELEFDLCLFFLWMKINFAFQNALAAFFLVRPRPLEQPPEAKLLSSVWTKRSKI